ncbi:MAG: hypothetical protein ACRCTA_02605 [Bacilli bacterium]
MDEKVFSKLKLKEGMDLVILDKQKTYLNEFQKYQLNIKTNATKASCFILVAYTMEEAQLLFNVIESYLEQDYTLWICFPKKSSKAYYINTTRDMMHQLFSTKQCLGVTLIALDDDFSAMRYRNTNYIKSKK